MPPLRTGGYCYIHSPQTRADRRWSQQRGGRRNRVGKAAAPVAVDTIPALQTVLGQVLSDTLVQENSAKRSQAVARLLDVAHTLIETREVQSMLDTMAERLEQVERRRGRW